MSATLEIEKLNAILSEKLPEQESHPLMSEATTASGNGSVAISEGAAGAVIVTGNGNQVVINHSIDAEELVRRMHFVILQTSVTIIQNRLFKPTLPYKGLKNFDLDDEHLFFGRAQFLNDLVNELKQTNLILLLGASGSGKSSVVRAGLIPRFKSEWESQGLKGFNLTFKPDLDPFESLYGCLLSKYTQSEAKIAQEGKANTLMRTIETLKLPDTQWLIFIDQFEELFTSRQPEKCKNFIAGLTELTRDKNNRSVKIIATMRVDFLDRLSPYRAFEKATQKHRPIITDMQPDELRLAIEQPAAHHGVVFEKELVAEIIKDVQGLQGQTVSLPLLQYTLELLWNEEIKTDKIVHDRTLNISTYRNLGGVRGALQQHVDKVYKEELSEPEQLAAKQIFLKIVGIAGDAESGTAWKPVRRRASRLEFDGSLEQAVVDKLIDKRLLISNREYGAQDSTVEIVHEILFTSWTMLSDWIRESRQNIALRNDLKDGIKRWQVKKSIDELWAGSRLEKVLELKQDPIFRHNLNGFNQEENKFINISQRRRDLQRYGLFVGYSLIATILLIVLASFFATPYFNEWGYKDYEKGEEGNYQSAIGNYESAIQKYSIAIAIGSVLDKSRVVVSLYNRGVAYQKLEKIDLAFADYEKAISIDKNFALAYNNLAYLSISRDKDYNKAIELLNYSQYLEDYKDDEYLILKNLGWARFGLGDYSNAERDLSKAINLDVEDKKKGAAYCLLAQVLTAKKPKSNAKNEWKSCIKFGDAKIPEQKEWMDLAKKYLKIN